MSASGTDVNEIADYENEIETPRHIYLCPFDDSNRSEVLQPDSNTYSKSGVSTSTLPSGSVPGLEKNGESNPIDPNFDSGALDTSVDGPHFIESKPPPTPPCKPRADSQAGSRGNSFSIPESMSGSLRRQITETMLQRQENLNKAEQTQMSPHAPNTENFTDEPRSWDTQIHHVSVAPSASFEHDGFLSVNSSSSEDDQDTNDIFFPSIRFDRRSNSANPDVSSLIHSPEPNNEAVSAVLFDIPSTMNSFRVPEPSEPAQRLQRFMTTE